MNSSVVISRDRKGLTVSVASEVSGIRLKEALDKAENGGKYVFIPGEITKTTGGYSVFIRQKLSLKSYLSETPPGEEMARCLIRSLCGLWTACRENRLNFYNFLFDIDAVFISGVMENMEFLYLPGARLGPGNNSLSDMLSMLMIYSGSQQAEELLKAAAEITGEAERGGEDFPLKPLEELTDKKRIFGGKEIIAKPEAAAGLVLGIAGGALFYLKADFTFMLGWLLCVAGVIALFALRKVKRREPGDIKVLSRALYLKECPAPKGDEITIGRDGAWADMVINDARVSRRHAVVTAENQSLCVRDLFSANGTYVNDERIESGKTAVLSRGQRLRFGTDKEYHVGSRLDIELFSKINRLLHRKP